MSDISEQFKQMKKIADLVPCGIGIFDLQTSVPVFLNKAYYELIGYSEEEYAQFESDFDYLLLPQDKPIAHNGSSEYHRTGSVNDYEYRIVRKDGGIVWVKLDIATLSIDGKQYALASFNNITKERDISEQLTLIANNVGTSLSLIRISEKGEEVIYGNSDFYKNVGISPEAYRANMPLIDRSLVSDEDYERIMRATREALVSGKPGEITHKYYRPDGKTLWLTRRFAAIKQSAPDTYLLVSAVTNVTAEKENELNAAIEKRRFQTVIEELNAAVFEWNLKTGEFYCSEAYKNYAFSHINQNDILNNRGSLDVVHPDDVEELKRFFTMTDSGEKRVEVTLRLKMLDETFRWCRMIGFFYRDKDGTPQRTVGVIIDVNEEHERSFMLNSILNELPGGVAIFCFTDHLECQYYNEGFVNISGLTHEEADELIKNGTFLKKVVAPIDYKRFIDELMSSISSGSPINITYRFVHKDRSIKWIHLSANKIREENGHPVYYCVFSTPSEEASLYRSIVEDSAVGVIVLDRKKRNILYLNDMGRILTGLTGDDIVLGCAVNEIMNKQNIKPILTDEDISKLKYDSYTDMHAERNGKYLALRIRAIIWNSIDAYILYITDETKEHDEQLRLQRLIDGVPTGIGIYDIKNGEVTLVYLNNAYYREVGMTRGERRIDYGEKALEAVHPDDVGAVMNMIGKLSSGTDEGSVLVRLSTFDGEWIWFKLLCSVVERKKEHIRVYASFTNCNEMVIAQRKLEENRIREQIMLSSIPGGAVIYRLKKDKRVEMEYASEGFARLMEYRDADEM